jgi:glycosyltransferase involved in cell wall biosynthesis
VSIIIPCYNASPFLRETLDSTIRQSVPPLEVILVDDGSTDDSRAIAESYGPPVRVMHQENQGESVAMNWALAIARGEYVVILGADDVLHPRLLEIQLRALDGVRDGVACCGFSFFTDSVDRAFPPSMPQATSFFPGIIAANLAPPSCWMFPMELVMKAGCFYGPQRHFEDWDLNWRVGVAGGVLVPVHELGFYYRQHVKSQLATLAAADRAFGHAVLMERMCRAFFDHPALLKQYGDTLFWSAYSALRACRGWGVGWDRLRLLACMIEEVALRRPPGLDPSRFAGAVRAVGLRRAESIVSLWKGQGERHAYRPSWLPPATP